MTRLWQRTLRGGFYSKQETRPASYMTSFEHRVTGGLSSESRDQNQHKTPQTIHFTGKTDISATLATMTRRSTPTTVCGGSTTHREPNHVVYQELSKTRTRTPPGIPYTQYGPQRRRRSSDSVGGPVVSLCRCESGAQRHGTGVTVARQELTGTRAKWAQGTRGGAGRWG